MQIYIQHSPHYEREVRVVQKGPYRDKQLKSTSYPFWFRIFDYETGLTWDHEKGKWVDKDIRTMYYPYTLEQAIAVCKKRGFQFEIWSGGSLLERAISDVHAFLRELEGMLELVKQNEQ